MVSKPTMRAVALALSLCVAAPAHAAVFAQFLPDTADADFKWIGSGSGGDLDSIVNPASTSPQAVAVHFSYLDPALTALGNLQANFVLSSSAPSGNPALDDGGGLFTQINVNGTFSFTYTGPTTTIGSITLTQNLTNLLSGVFTDAWIQGIGGSGSANVSSNLGSASFTSDIEPFLNRKPGSEEFAFNLLDVTPGFHANPGFSLRSFTANGGGNFSFLGAPEPGAWSLMIVGFSGLGLALRLRRRTAAA